MATQDMMVYYDRWKALDDLMTEAAAIYGKYTLKDFPRRKTILLLLSSLQEFAKGQFLFFYFGFGFEYDDDKRLPCDPILQTWDEYPPEDMLRGVLSQIGHDFALIQRAADQRVNGGEKMKATLQKADQLAWMAVKPAVDFGVVDSTTTVLTYFEKVAEFYCIPYANVALISIPYTCASDNPRDFLALPHEVGHYVYRRFVGKAEAFKKSDLGKLLATPGFTKAYQEWIKAIFEETFADTYAGLIAGPVMAIDFESLSLANSQKDFKEGDGTHPNPALRPLVYCRVLAASKDFPTYIQGNWQTIGETLAAGWNRQLVQRHITEFVIKTTKPEGQNEITTAQSLEIKSAITAPDPKNSGLADVASPTPSEPSLNPLDKVVNSILDTIMKRIDTYVAGQQPPPSIEPWPGWAGMITAQTTPGELFGKYKDYIAAKLDKPEVPPVGQYPSAVAASDRDACFHAPRSWRAWLLKANMDIPDAATKKFWSDWLSGNIKRWPITEQILCGEAVDPQKMQPGTWGYVLNAEGWTKGGPSGSNSAPPLE